MTERAPTAIDRELGLRIRARRLAAGVSQEKLAEHLGVTFQQVQKYEGGINRIPAARLLAVSRALQVPVERFFDGLRG